MDYILGKNKYSFLRNDEEYFIYKSLEEKINKSYEKGITTCSDFLDPFWQKTADELAKSFYLNVHFYSGFIESERKVLSFSPYNNNDNSLVSIFCANYKNNFTKIFHRDVLGALIGSGIDRKSLGDIIITDKVYFAALSTLDNFILSTNFRIKKNILSFTKTDSNLVKMPELKKTYSNCIVSSMRADQIIHSIFNIKKNDVDNLIKLGKVKINYRLENKSSRNVEFNSLISVRGYGRAFVTDQYTNTRSGKICLTYYRIVEE